MGAEWRRVNGKNGDICDSVNNKNKVKKRKESKIKQNEMEI